VNLQQEDPTARGKKRNVSASCRGKKRASREHRFRTKKKRSTPILQEKKPESRALTPWRAAGVTIEKAVPRKGAATARNSGKKNILRVDNEDDCRRKRCSKHPTAAGIRRTIETKKIWILFLREGKIQQPPQSGTRGTNRPQLWEGKKKTGDLD